MNLMSSVKYGKFVEAKNIPDYDYRYLRNKYDEFLEQSLEIWQFVPCKLVDDVWVVLEKPIMFYSEDNIKRLKGIEIEIANAANNRVKEYEQAKSLCIFEGFEVVSNTNFITIWQVNGKYLNWDKKDQHFMFFSGFNIERLMQDFDLTLTPNTIKNLGL